MTSAKEYIDLYNQGIYTFGEIVSMFIRLAADEEPQSFAADLTADFIVNIAVDVAVPPGSPDDILYLKGSRDMEVAHFRGAWSWHHYLFDS